MVRATIDRYSYMDDLYARASKTGVKKFVNLNDRYTPLKATTPALADWFRRYPSEDNFNMRPQRTTHNSRKAGVIV